MNRFLDLIQELNKRAQAHETGLSELDKLVPADDEKAEEQRFRLPYSSDPRAVEERWK